jgi:hypothetical protein
MTQPDRKGLKRAKPELLPLSQVMMGFRLRLHDRLRSRLMTEYDGVVVAGYGWVLAELDYSKVYTEWI